MRRKKNYNENLEKMQNLEKSRQDLSEKIYNTTIELHEKNAEYQESYRVSEEKKRIYAHVMYNRTRQQYVAEVETEKLWLDSAKKKEQASTKYHGEEQQRHQKALDHFNKGKQEQHIAEDGIKAQEKQLQWLNETLLKKVGTASRWQHEFTLTERNLTLARRSLMQSQQERQEANVTKKQAREGLDEEIAKHGDAFEKVNATYRLALEKGDAVATDLHRAVESRRTHEDTVAELRKLEQGEKRGKEDKERTLKDAERALNQEKEKLKKLREATQKTEVSLDKEVKRQRSMEDELQAGAENKESMKCLIRNETKVIDPIPCEDAKDAKDCHTRAEKGECTKKAHEMMAQCRKTCGCKESDSPQIRKLRHVVYQARESVLVGQEQKAASEALVRTNLTTAVSRAVREREATARNVTLVNTTMVAKATGNVEGSRRALMQAQEGLRNATLNRTNVEGEFKRAQSDVPKKEASVKEADKQIEARVKEQETNERVLARVQSKLDAITAQEDKKKKRIQLLINREAFYNEQVESIGLKIKPVVRDAVEDYLKNSWFSFASPLLMGTIYMAEKVLDALGLGLDEAMLVEELMLTMKGRDKVKEEREAVEKQLTPPLALEEEHQRNQHALKTAQTKLTEARKQKEEAQDALKAALALVELLKINITEAKKVETEATDIVSLARQELKKQEAALQVARNALKEAEAMDAQVAKLLEKAKAEKTAGEEKVKAEQQMIETRQKEVKKQEHILQEALDAASDEESRKRAEHRFATLRKVCSTSEQDTRAYVLSESPLYELSVEQQRLHAVIKDHRNQTVFAEKQERELTTGASEAQRLADEARKKHEQQIKTREEGEGKLEVLKKLELHAEDVVRNTTVYISETWDKVKKDQPLRLEKEALFANATQWWENITAKETNYHTLVHNLTLTLNATKHELDQAMKEESDAKFAVKSMKFDIYTRRLNLTQLMVELQLPAREAHEKRTMDSWKAADKAMRQASQETREQDARWRKHTQRLEQMDREQELNRKEAEKKTADMKFQDAQKKAEACLTKVQEFEKNFETTTKDLQEKREAVAHWYDMYLKAVKEHDEQDPEERSRSFSWKIEGSGAG